VSARDRVAVVIPDITRPMPADRLLPWLFAELAHVPARQVTIINGTGSHRANTPAELERMVGRTVASTYHILNHAAQDPAMLAPAGRTKDGRPDLLDRAYVEADKRIVLGFIEPHFMAGFSGGYKGIFPALADIESITHYHRAAVIADPRSTWGVLDGNPTQAQIRENGALLPLHFCVNVTLNRDRDITGFYCGDPIEAHERGCAAARATAMVACERPYPIVVTTNGGYPLDQNLYQTVKGMSAAAQIVQDGGYVLTTARCNDGFPAHGNFKKLLVEHPTPQAILDTVLAPGFSMFDQWEAQMLAMILVRARVGLYSEIPADDLRRAHVEPVADVGARLAEELRHVGRDAPVAVLPEGPMTIPYLRP
jgi:nickel-dependent lactate racemase